MELATHDPHEEYSFVHDILFVFNSLYSGQVLISCDKVGIGV